MYASAVSASGATSGSMLGRRGDDAAVNLEVCRDAAVVGWATTSSSAWQRFWAFLLPAGRAPITATIGANNGTADIGTGTVLTPAIARSTACPGAASVFAVSIWWLVACAAYDALEYDPCCPCRCIAGRGDRANAGQVQALLRHCERQRCPSRYTGPGVASNGKGYLVYTSSSSGVGRVVH